MENAALLFLLESILGKGSRTSKGNYAFKCPFCEHHKKKLEINVVTNIKKENPWHCWVCEAKGKTIRTLFKQMKVTKDKIDELNLVIVPSREDPKYHTESIAFPKEFISLSDKSSYNKITEIKSRHALHFLHKRGITDEDIIKYNIGFCIDGNYADRVIIPSYDEKGNLNYFIARSYNESGQKYKNPPVDAKSVIGWELYINWNAPIILVEGIFDSLTIKRNVIPLFGKVLHEKLMKKLVSSDVKKIYVALDKDAIKNALKHAETLLSYGKEVYLVELDGKDANEIGYEKFLDNIEKTSPLTFQSLLEKKLSII
jgi:DNA primase